jgi:hypothetical protein
MALFGQNDPPKKKKCSTLCPPKRPTNTPSIRKYRVIARKKTGQSYGRLFVKNAIAGCHKDKGVEMGPKPLMYRYVTAVAAGGRWPKPMPMPTASFWFWILVWESLTGTVPVLSQFLSQISDLNSHEQTPLISYGITHTARA